VDDSVFHIDVEVDEVDIGQVEVGQSAFIELDALPGQGLTGSVTSISPIAAAEAGDVVSYIVRVDLDPAEVPLRSGMTATVDIVVEELEGVLRIPNWAIRIDRRTGDTYVNIQGPDGGLVEVDVELGLRGDAYSQVVSGLEKGQEVLVSLEREELSLFGGGEE
jgi:HlyD family secretion protein